MKDIKILLVEDDNNLGYILKEYLSMYDFEVTWSKDGEEGFQSFEQGDFDLCILDVMMPKTDGFTLAKKIKNINREMPLIFLTAKALKVDKLRGFKIGADDYIVKPVDEEELLARIRAIINRSIAAKSDGSSDLDHFKIGSYEFDFKNQALILGDEKKIITTKEAQVLRELCINKGNLLDRKATLKALWGDSDYFNRRSMDVFISKLRKYLSQDESVSITNVHGKGFILED